MAHQRKTIRDAIKAALLSRTNAGARVFTNRSDAAWTSEIPLIVVYTKDETAEIFNKEPLELRRTMRVAVEIITQGSTPDDDADAIAKDAEDALAVFDPVGDVCETLTLVQTETELSSEGEKLVAGLRLTYEAVYYTRHPSTLQPTDSFRKANFKADLPPADGRIEIEGNQTLTGG